MLTIRPVAPHVHRQGATMQLRTTRRTVTLAALLASFAIAFVSASLARAQRMASDDEEPPVGFEPPSFGLAPTTAPRVSSRAVPVGVNLEAAIGYGGMLGYRSDVNDGISGPSYSGAVVVSWGKDKPRVGVRVSGSYARLTGRELGETNNSSWASWWGDSESYPARDVLDATLVAAQGGLQASWRNGLWVSSLLGFVWYKRSYTPTSSQDDVRDDLFFEAAVQGGYNLALGEHLALQLSAEAATTFISHVRLQARAALVLRM